MVIIYDNIRHSLQKKMRQEYWQYIENIIDYSEEDNNSVRKFKQKKFRSSLKTSERPRRVLPHCAAREILSAVSLTKLKF